MSDYESHIGKLRKVNLQEKTREEFFKEKCEEADYTEMKGSDWQDTALSYVDDVYEKYFVVNDEVWELFDHMQPDSWDGIHIVDNKDGTYSFSTTFYNGGTYLNEVLEEAISDL